MEDLIHADVFFFVTTIFIVVVTAAIFVASIYVISILKDLKVISQKARIEGEEIIEDVKNLRENVKREGANLKQISRFFSALFKKRK
jgi:biopolymer transport protein ExbB/TolQ